MGEFDLENISLRANTDPSQMGSFGANVRRIREARGLQANELAERMGVSPSVVSQWENDRKGLPETPTLFKIAKALRVPIEELLRDVDSAYTKVLEDYLDSEVESLRRLKDATASGEVSPTLARILMALSKTRLESLEHALQEPAREQSAVDDESLELARKIQRLEAADRNWLTQAIERLGRSDSREGASSNNAAALDRRAGGHE